MRSHQWDTLLYKNTNKMQVIPLMSRLFYPTKIVYRPQTKKKCENEVSEYLFCDLDKVIDWSFFVSDDSSFHRTHIWHGKNNRWPCFIVRSLFGNDEFLELSFHFDKFWLWKLSFKHTILYPVETFFEKCMHFGHLIHRHIIHNKTVHGKDTKN